MAGLMEYGTNIVAIGVGHAAISYNLGCVYEVFESTKLGECKCWAAFIMYVQIEQSSSPLMFVHVGQHLHMTRTLLKVA